MKRGSILLLAASAAVAAYVMKILLLLDINKKVFNHRPGPCRKVEGVEHGSEDIELIEDEGIAFVSSGVLYMYQRAENVKGQILLYDFNQTGKYKAVPLKINGAYDQENFYPHGISHYKTSTGNIRLFVICHTKKFKHYVMVLDYDRNSKQLNVVKTIKDDKFIRPNDLVAVSEDSFLLTNDGSAQSQLVEFIHWLSMIPTGSVVYYDGQKSSWVLSKSTCPNGIVVHPDGKHVIISRSTNRVISVYLVKKNFQSLSRLIDVPLETTIDNLNIDSDGVLWTGAHPIMREAYTHLGDCDNPHYRSPSQVLRIKFSGDFKTWEITEPFADDGRLISGSSVAVSYGNQLLIGSVCRELVHCYTTKDTL
ncbi:unnamed protein product [Cylicocyclus nassatus]|uniref:Arylesterase n=1 Tax=Cylicocyclus nassatus TaxID=53992 RepID=A0AA36GL35_CYLNA|nr:unnamed protein product [Cylicocyclus nassatus]